MNVRSVLDAFSIVVINRAMKQSMENLFSFISLILVEVVLLDTTVLIEIAYNNFFFKKNELERKIRETK